MRQLTLHFFAQSAKPTVVHLLPTLSTPSRLWPACVCLLCPPLLRLLPGNLLHAQSSAGEKLRGVWDVTLENVLPSLQRGEEEGKGEEKGAHSVLP